MSASGNDDQPSFERFALGWRIPPRILEPLLHPPADARAETPEDRSDTSETAPPRD